MSVQWFGRIFVLAVVWISISKGVQYDTLGFKIRRTHNTPFMGSMTVSRTPQRESKFTVTFNVTTDDLNGFDLESVVYRSAIGNNHFVKIPVHIPKKSICDFFSNEFRNHLLGDMANYTNLPIDFDPNVNYCDLLKQGYAYEVRNYSYSASSLPDNVLLGTYKLQTKISHRATNEVHVAMEGMARFY